jgi:NADH-quinone oxidoreductase subunit L
MLVGVLAIAGTPTFSGWYSKDAIIAEALSFSLANPSHFLLLLLPVMTAGITCFYMFRMWFMTFTGPPKDDHVHEHAHEAPRTMTVPLIVLAVFSVGVAWSWPLWNLRPATSLFDPSGRVHPISGRSRRCTWFGTLWAGLTRGAALIGAGRQY